VRCPARPSDSILLVVWSPPAQPGIILYHRRDCPVNVLRCAANYGDYPPYLYLLHPRPRPETGPGQAPL